MSLRPRGRPEETADAAIYYDTSEAKKYAVNSRMVKIQRQMAERCLELLELPPDQRHLLLDLGCGSGLSGEAISDANHIWMGCDISPDMLAVAQARESDGDLFHSDLGQGLYFREGMFDGAISVSTLQWMCSCSQKNHNPWRRLHRFFESLYRCLKRTGRAVFQLYPKNSEQLEMIVDMAKRAGFQASLMIDNPDNTGKSKKYYLLCGATVVDNPDRHKENSETCAAPTISFAKKSGVGKRRKKKKSKGGKAWVMEQKDKRRRRGKEVAKDSKYTGRRRGPKF